MTKKSNITLGVIPARAGSKGVPHKNIKNVAGKPLIAYAIECGLASESLDHVMVSTDSTQIVNIAQRYGADVPSIRPAELAHDSTPMLPVLQHAIVEAEKYYNGIVATLVLIDPTAPLRTVEDIESALRLFKQNDCEAVVSGNTAHRSPFFNMVKLKDGYVRLAQDFGSSIGRRQDAPELYDLNTVVWIYSRKALMEEQQRIPDRTILYLVPRERSLDLDTEFDFRLLENLLKTLYDVNN